MALSRNLIDKYNAQRQVFSTEHLCNAPFVNMYLNSWGNVGACWLTLDNAPRYPQQSLREIWFGEYFEKIRTNIKNNNLETLCGVCEKRLKDGVFPQVLARAYDLEYPNTPYPQIMEFELSNLCNLTCVMCKGSLSSKIRKEREQLGALQTPYDDAFIEQLKEFLPHLKEARFNGGEPFLQPMCWKAWEAIAETNPNILITVATNGTLLTQKMKNLIERCRFRVNVSLDSLSKENYEKIRVGSDFEEVVNNIQFYKEYCERKGTILSVMVNPMRMNWKEMPEFVRWCSKHDYHLWYNTVWRPRAHAIWTLPSAELESMQKWYREQKFDAPQSVVGHHNLRVYESFVEAQMGGWIRDQVEKEKVGVDYTTLMKQVVGAKKRFLSRPVFQKFEGVFVELESKTNRVFAADTMYHYLGELKDEELTEKFTAYSGDRLIEWVYQACDYY